MDFKSKDRWDTFNYLTSAKASSYLTLHCLYVHSIESTGIIKLHAHSFAEKFIYIISIEDANNIVSNEFLKKGSNSRSIKKKV